MVVKGFDYLTRSIDPAHPADAQACLLEAVAAFGLSGAASISFFDPKKNLEAWERIEKSFGAALYQKKTIRKLIGLSSKTRREVRRPSGRCPS